MKLVRAEGVVKGFEHLGYPEHLALALGVVEVGCTFVYLIPRTAVLGAILLTGYLGGAIATHARLLELQFLAPLVLGVLVWGGLFLRDPRVRALIPVRK
jgi:DoxX-like family